MRELIVAEFITLDGVIQAPGGADEDTEGGFTHGGWTQPYWHDDIGTHFYQAMSQADALLLGRKTWQIHDGAFERMHGDPFADALNNIREYVVSTTLESASAWRNSTLIRENVVEAVRQLKQQPGKNILVDGGSVLIHALAQIEGGRFAYRNEALPPNNRLQRTVRCNRLLGGTCMGPHIRRLPWYPSHRPASLSEGDQS